MIRAGFIGCGNMGGALAAVAARSVGGEQILTADHNPGKLEALRSAWGTVPSSAAECAAKAPVLFLGVKPQMLRAAAEEIRPELEAREDRPLIVSMAAGVPASAVAELLGGARILRIMPNTPVAVGAGVLLYAPGPEVTPEDEADFLTLMDGAGVCVKLEEAKLDMGSAVTGCGPAFVCLFLEAMTDAGVRCGLPRDKAALFALHTFAGTAQLALTTGTDPAVLRAAVCSPGGSTIEGVAALEEHGARAAMLAAVDAAYRRTLELGK